MMHLQNFGNQVRRLLRWIGRHELGVNVATSALALGIFAFMKVASEISDGDTAALDRAFLLRLRDASNLADPIGPAWLEEMGRDFTALGGIPFLTLITLLVVGYLLLIRKTRSAIYVVVSVVGATILEVTLKSAFARQRPEIVPHLHHVQSTSFPSGHSMLAAAVYLTLGTLVARVETKLIVKAYVFSCALLFSVLVGVTRVYLGVHWPTDVLAGWAAGAAWAALSWLIARALQRRGTLEPSSGDNSEEDSKLTPQAS